MMGVVLVRGGGDLGTGVAHTLACYGFRVAVLEAEKPTAVRRTVAFAAAVFDGHVIVEGVSARLVGLDDLREMGGRSPEAGDAEDESCRGWPDWVPVVVDPDGWAIEALRPDAVVDARMAKRNLGTCRGDAPVTVALGPGFEAGRDVDVVIETMRGDSLGRVIESGSAERNTGVPAEVAGVGAERVIRSTASGLFDGARSIGDLVEKGEIVGRVGGEPVRAPIGGLLRGLVADGVPLSVGAKVGDVDPRGRAVDPATMSDKARRVGGAVLEVLLSKGVAHDPAGADLGAG